MEMNNINDKDETNITGLKSELSAEEEKRRAEAAALIFNNNYNGHSTDNLDKAGNIDRGENRTPLPPDHSTPKNFDIRSEFGITSAETIPDINIYQNKKTFAQGMMDLALFSANANQLRYVVESVNHPYYYSGIVLISFSLIFQVLVGVGLLINTRYSVNCPKKIHVANRINNFTIVAIFLVTVINVFICAFGVVTNGAVGATSAVFLGNRYGEFGEGEEANATTTEPTSME